MSVAWKDFEMQQENLWKWILIEISLERYIVCVKVGSVTRAFQGVNFTNILQTAFAPISVRQKMQT